MSQEIVLDEQLTIAQAEGLCKSLEEHFCNSASVVFDAGKVKRIDMAVLQILASFFISMDQAGVPAGWTSVSDDLRTATELTGLQSVLKM